MGDHFHGKNAMQHIVEVQAEGVLTSAEIHGAETPGFLFGATDAARDTVVAILLTVIVLEYYEFLPEQVVTLLLAFSSGWLVWKVGRAARLSWARLERLHRVMDEERREIEQNRPQEKEELKALYQAKGLQGKLLDDVVDVLMADSERALRVMLEEEMGFRLEENEHPLMQGLGAGLGVLIAAFFMLVTYLSASHLALFGVAFVVVGASCYLTAIRERNKVITSVLWNVSLALFSCLVAYYCMQFVTH
jgi:hypothetical protein